VTVGRALVCVRPEVRGSPARPRAADASARADVRDRVDGVAVALVRVAERVAVRVVVTRS
jgi:hypothetical protein